MTRLFCVGMILAAVVFAMPALASVPYPANCSVEWITYDITNTLVIVIDPENGNLTPPPPPPLHSHSYMMVTVNDQFSLGIPNVLVTLTFTDPSGKL